MRTKHTFRLPPDLAGQLADHANRKRVPQALIVETALASFLSPDNSERMEAALGRRLDQLTRHVERLERHITISNEALALFGNGMKVLSRPSGAGWPGARPWPRRSRSTSIRRKRRQPFLISDPAIFSFATPRHAD